MNNTQDRKISRLLGKFFFPVLCSFFPDPLVLGEPKKGLSVWSERAPIGDDKKSRVVCECQCQASVVQDRCYTAQRPVTSQCRGPAPASSSQFLMWPVGLRKPPKTGRSQWVFSIEMLRFSVF